MRAVIFANGELHDLQGARDFLQTCDIIIAADGGTRHVLAVDVFPDVIVGDLDSLSPDQRRRLEASGCRIISFPARKDETDLELALHYAAAEGATEIVVLAAVTCFVWYSRRTVTHFPGVRDLPKTAAALICASGVLLVFAIAGLGSGVAEARYDLSPRSLLLLVWMGPIAFAGASFLWLRATRMLGVTVAGIHQNEIPFFVMALLLAFGGSFEWLHVAGAILVLAGAALAQLRHLRPLTPGESQNQASGS